MMRPGAVSGATRALRCRSWHKGPKLLGPRGRDFSLPLAGVTAHVRPAARPPPSGHSPASHAGDAPGGT
eukprot:4492939-Prymnesium_polylepis.1